VCVRARVVGPDWLGGAATAVTVGIIGGPPGQPEDGSAIVESYLSAMRQSRAEGREDWQRKVAESHRHQLDSSTVQHVRNGTSNVHLTVKVLTRRNSAVFASAQDTICSLPFEPTLGLMHVAEHVERTLPNIVEIQVWWCARVCFLILTLTFPSIYREHRMPFWTRSRTRPRTLRMHMLNSRGGWISRAPREYLKT